MAWFGRNFEEMRRNRHPLYYSRVQQKKCLLPCFVAPSRIDGFMRRLHAQNVCLENITCEKFVVSGLIRVTNLSYRKEVTVRFTLDGWETYRDIWADYMSSCSDGKNDKFTFRITVPFDFEVNRHMEFAIRYRVLNQEFWITTTEKTTMYSVWNSCLNSFRLLFKINMVSKVNQEEKCHLPRRRNLIGYEPCCNSFHVTE